MAKIDVVAKNINVDELANVLFLLVTAEACVLKFETNVGELLVNALCLEVSCTSISKIRNEADQAFHGLRHGGKSERERRKC